MTVHVVTDSSSCLPVDMAAEAGVTVLPLHTSGEGSDKTTSGLGQLELTAMYARLLERGGDDGVVALHLSKELSATWSNAITAAGIFEDNAVRVIDTNSAGMVLGYAALAAAKKAQQGASLDEVEVVAKDVIHNSSLWLYVSKIDTLRKGGRLSTGQSLLTTALATRPIFELEEGKLTLASKARTQSKALDKMVDLVLEDILPGSHEAVRAAIGKAKEQFHEEAKARRGSRTKSMLDIVNPKKAEVESASDEETQSSSEALKARIAAARVEALARPELANRTTRIAIHQTEATEVAADLKSRVEAMVEDVTQANPELTVVVDVVDLSPAIATHTGAGSLGVVVVVDEAQDKDLHQPEIVDSLTE